MSDYYERDPEAEEYERLLRERDEALDRRNQAVEDYNYYLRRRNELVEEYNRLIVELQNALNKAVEAINYTAQARNYIVPKLSYSANSASEAAALADEVSEEITVLSQKYFIAKNLSTASKKLTQLNDEYRRKFGLYETLRRVTLGYVVGVDSNIIDNEKLRVTVEKNYLQNFDYWVSHCIMATMLWVSNEPEAAARAVNKAMEMDSRKSALFFLLINLRFYRREAAAKWFEYYIKEIDVNNVGDEMRILLQAYLYNICGDDPELRAKMTEEFVNLLASARSHTRNYDEFVIGRVLDFIESSVHKTFEDFDDMRGVCHDYGDMIEALERAERNEEFTKFFDALYNEDSEAPKNLVERIQNVLYDLVNTYDEAEMAIIRAMDYNEFVMKARGDIVQAQRAYNNKYQPDRPQTLADLLVKLAFPSRMDEVDVRVRKFAVSFLVSGIIEAFVRYRRDYVQLSKETHPATVDGCDLTIDENDTKKAQVELATYYKKNRKKFINNDKGVKALTAFSITFWVAFAISVLGTVGWFLSDPFFELPVWLMATMIGTFFAAVVFTVWLAMHKAKVGARVAERAARGLNKLQKAVDDVIDWRKKYRMRDEQFDELITELNNFTSEKENSDE